MELRAYWQILLKKWWLVLITFLVTLTATVVFTFTRPLVYQATATFVVVPNSSLNETWDFVQGLEVLSRRAEISSTYAEIADSRLIKTLAADELGLSLEQRDSLVINSKLRSGTNILQVTVEGGDPILVMKMTNMVGAKIEAYVRDIYETYELKPLDSATVPSVPAGPNRALYLALGAALGGSLGIGLAFLSHYLQAPLETMVQFSIIDNETGAYSKQYFMQRLTEEMGRARRNNYSLSLALMNVDQVGEVNSVTPQIRVEALRKVTTLLRQYMREEDLLARFDSTVFAFLLIDTPSSAAKEMMERLQTRIAWTPLEIEKSGIKLNLSGAVGVVDYAHDEVGQDELVAMAKQAMEKALALGYGQIHLISSHEAQSTTRTGEKD